LVRHQLAIVEVNLGHGESDIHCGLSLSDEACSHGGKRRWWCQARYLGAWNSSHPISGLASWLALSTKVIANKLMVSAIKIWYKKQ